MPVSQIVFSRRFVQNYRFEVLEGVVSPGEDVLVLCGGEGTGGVHQSSARLHLLHRHLKQLLLQSEYSSNIPNQFK